MTSKFTLRILSLAMVLIVCVAHGSAQYDAADALAAGSPVEGRTVIMGTWYWDIESNKQGKLPGSDLWWQQVDQVQQFLTPLGGTGITLLERKDFDAIGADDLKNVKYRRCPIENVEFESGSILGIKTADGNYVKMRIVGYRDLHDVSFTDIQYARPSWSAFLLSRPNRPNYHLEVDWMIFPSGKAAQL